MWARVGDTIKYMSVLSNKKVLIIGKEIEQIINIRKILESHGVEVVLISCAKFDIDQIKKENSDLIILNHIYDEKNCSDIFSKLKEFKINQTIPVFVLAESTKIDSFEILTYGASDYITPEEDAQSVLLKVNNIFSEGDDFSGNSAIDITPHEAFITSKGIKVYVVEDDPLLRNLLATRLKKSSFVYEFSVSADGAIHSMRQFLPQVIILDLMLPGKNGFELLSEIRQDETLMSVPVIIFSNKDSQEDRNKASDLGVSAFRVKAMTDLSELVETIESLVK